MKNSNKTALLAQLNQAMQTINAAIKRSPVSNSIIVKNMNETKTSIQNAIELIEVCCDEQE